MKLTVLDLLNRAMIEALRLDESVYLLGEDILDPYGGAFKVTRGCSTAFPQRVIPTPISEAGLAGLAAGMALRGLKPVLEIMFGDFITLLADQLVNHIAKFRWMYNNTVTVPLVIRTPMGGRRGYGPTHSQTLEKLFLGVPGLTVLAPTTYSIGQSSADELLKNAILRMDDPVLFIENKLQYLQPVLSEEDLAEFDVHVLYDERDKNEEFPFHRFRVRGAPPSNVTVAAYGYMAELSRQALRNLAFEEEIFTELVVPTRLSPFAVSPILESVAHTGRVLLVEEGTRSLGWGAEVGVQVAEGLGADLKSIKRLAARETPVPAAAGLEKSTLPQIEDIQETLRKMSRSNG